jgi:DNA repair exonuclease SbcCD ATPase subunit
MEMKAAEVQEQIDTLKGKLDTFETQLTTLQKNILEKRTAAGQAMFEGRDMTKLEDEIAKLELRSKTIEFAKTTVQTKLSEANENLNTAKRTDATERIKEIRTSLDQTANTLKKILEEALTSAQVFEGLLNEAWSINQTAKVPISPLGSWINHSTVFDKASHVDSILDEVLKRLDQFRPKNDA